jgi:hypothetical protein
LKGSGNERESSVPGKHHTLRAAARGGNGSVEERKLDLAVVMVKNADGNVIGLIQSS